MRVWNLSTLFFIFIFGFCFGHFGVFFSQCLKKKTSHRSLHNTMYRKRKTIRLWREREIWIIHIGFFCGGVLKFYSSSYLSNAGWEEVHIRVPRVLLATPSLPQTECYIIWNQGFSFHTISCWLFLSIWDGGGRRWEEKESAGVLSFS